MNEGFGFYGNCDTMSVGKKNTEIWYHASYNCSAIHNLINLINLLHE